MAETALQESVPSGWSIEAFESCDDKWSLVIINAADDLTASYVVTKTFSGFAMEELRDDELSPVCECRAVKQLVSVLDVHPRAARA